LESHFSAAVFMVLMVKQPLFLVEFFPALEMFKSEENTKTSPRICSSASVVSLPQCWLSGSRLFLNKNIRVWESGAPASSLDMK